MMVVMCVAQGCGSSCPSGHTCFAPKKLLASSSVTTDGCDVGTGGLGGDNLTLPVGQVLVGFDHFTRGSRLGSRGACDKIVYFYRGGVLFDQRTLVDFVNQHGLVKAVLRYNVPNSTATFPPDTIPRTGELDFTCVQRLGTSTTDWTQMQPSDNIPIPFEDLDFRVPVRAAAPFDNGVVKLTRDSSKNQIVAQWDVSTVVRGWATGQRPNNGFVLAGSNEGPEPDNDTCTSPAFDFRLELLPAR
jgi:hypothetical protein